MEKDELSEIKSGVSFIERHVSNRVRESTTLTTTLMLSSLLILLIKSLVVVTQEIRIHNNREKK